MSPVLIQTISKIFIKLTNYSKTSQVKNQSTLIFNFDELSFIYD